MPVLYGRRRCGDRTARRFEGRRRGVSRADGRRSQEATGSASANPDVTSARTRGAEDGCLASIVQRDARRIGGDELRDTQEALARSYTRGRAVESTLGAFQQAPSHDVVVRV